MYQKETTGVQQIAELSNRIGIRKGGRQCQMPNVNVSDNVSELVKYLSKGANDGEVSGHADLSELLVDHKSKDAHHGGTSVVKLNHALAHLGISIKGVPSEVKGSVTEVTDEVSRGGTVGRVLHDNELKETNEGNNLQKSGRRDGIGTDEGGNTVGEGGEGVTGVVNVARKVDSVTGGDLAKEGKLTDTSVLDFDVTKTVELLLVAIGNHAKRIEEAKRMDDTQAAGWRRRAQHLTSRTMVIFFLSSIPWSVNNNVLAVKSTVFVCHLK